MNKNKILFLMITFFFVLMFGLIFFNPTMKFDGVQSFEKINVIEKNKPTP